MQYTVHVDYDGDNTLIDFLVVRCIAFIVWNVETSARFFRVG